MVKLNELKKLPFQYHHKIVHCARCNIILDTSTGIYSVGNKNKRYMCSECTHNKLFIDPDNEPELMYYDFVLSTGQTIEVQEVI